MFQGGKRFTGSGGGGQVLDPPKPAFPTRGLFRGAGLSWDAQRPVKAVGAGTPAWKGLMGLWEAVVGACLARGGQGALLGTLLCAGRLQRAPLAAHCGCDVSMEGRSRRMDTQLLPPAQATPWEGNRRSGGGWELFQPLHKTFLVFKPAAGQNACTKVKRGQEPHFLISHFLQQIPNSKHCSLRVPQTPFQPPTAWPVQGRALVSQTSAAVTCPAKPQDRTEWRWASGGSTATCRPAAP